MAHRVTRLGRDVRERERLDLPLEAGRERPAQRREHGCLERVLGVKIGHVELRVVGGKIGDEWGLELAREEARKGEVAEERVRLQR